MAAAHPSSQHPSPQMDYPTTPTMNQSPISQPEWDKLMQDELRGFTQMVEGTQDPGQLDRQEITKRHWVENSERSECVNPSCKLKFSLTERKHHCRRCGEVFCWTCTNYQRRLSVLAEPDPGGKLYKVCYRCFDQGPQTVGATSTHTNYFKQVRQLCKSPEYSQKSTINDCVDHYNLPFDINAECERLIEGFQLSIGHSKIRSSMREIISPLTTVPTWQKARRWTPKSATDVCQRCHLAFGWLSKKYNCKVCGCVVCMPCSSTDLLVFVPDEEDRNALGERPRWAIIRIIGCPEIEPDIHLYLRVCNKCKDQLLEIQVNNQKSLSQSHQIEETNDVNSNVVYIYGKVVRFQEKIDAQLPKYRQLIDGLEIGLGCPKSLPQVRSNIQILAKAQGDLSDHFTSFVFTVMSIKQLKPQTPAQQSTIRNLLKCKFEYYHDNMYIFRQLMRRLESVTPSEVLERIQEIVDLNAINSAYLATSQLSFEALNLCMKFKLNEQFASLIRKTSEVICGDLKVIVIQGGEDWDTHQQQVTHFVKIQLKKENHDKLRYIRPSRRQIRAIGAEYIKSFLPERCEQVVTQIGMQLNAKCAEKQFKNSKDSLARLKETFRKIIEMGNWEHIEN
ncbi:uncharacterized protein LOC102810146 [Saccoglossus kowalevskii]|uniref:Uncharacterized protein LOC102810146 n=1 Tax=Saccoglossus kowalevskii TaxID=10224 RepID=A0ABM0LVW0_SACKO|nr:PREDICTED: uncharacterized protein LOC102810146 [Saccoglossus kowalevskii]